MLSGARPGAERKETPLSERILLYSEPLFYNPRLDESGGKVFEVPLGAESWVHWFAQQGLDRDQIAGGLAREYISIGDALNRMRIPFRIIVAHRQLMDEMLTLLVLSRWSVRGLGLDQSIPIDQAGTIFPRDMLTIINGEIFVNPEANFHFDKLPFHRSSLGEGGAVLQQGNKVLLIDPIIYKDEVRSALLKDIEYVSRLSQVGLLPYPTGITVDLQSDLVEEFSSNHIDRASAFLHGDDGRDYLLTDISYSRNSHPPYSDFNPHILRVCRDLDVELVEVELGPESIPYSLNMEQFPDGRVLMTGGNPKLEVIVRQIVGRNNVFTTDIPILLFPIVRQAGIRCLMVFAPASIVGAPVRSG